MSGLPAVMYREGKIRATNALFIFWDVVYPLGYLLVFGVGMNEALGFSGLPTNYHAFFLAGVLGMAGFGIAANFVDRRIIQNIPRVIQPDRSTCRGSSALRLRLTLPRIILETGF